MVITSVEDHYLVLEVTSQATEDEIKKSFRRLAMKHHPDKNNGSHHATVKFQKVGSTSAEAEY
jgi:molecular chaperone DnaJ